MFPLMAREGGVLKRAGRPEAAVDLARIAGLKPAGVICEILKEDGTMARVPDLLRFSRQHQIRILTIAELIRYRMQHERLGAAGGPAQAAHALRRIPDHRLRE
jgi:3,4-dihydroxy 2-butanone 4-phosphate synthase/GTP cyclohydrolase II